jgi:GT2 family glycosyltransferase
MGLVDKAAYYSATPSLPESDESRSMRVSAVVLCFNSASHVERCVRSLLRDGSARDDEVLLIDNGSTDGTVSIVDRLVSEDLYRVRALKLSRNFGTTAPRNLGIRHARGRFIAIVDSDAELPTGVMDRLVERFRSDPTTGILAPRLVYPDGRSQLSTDVFPTLGRKVRRFCSLRSIEATEHVHSEVREVDYAISACWLLSREVIDAVGMLDEAIFYSPEDVDYCIRVWMAGYRVVHDGSTTVIHHAQEISRSRLPNWATFSHIAGLAYLYRKHGFCLSRKRLYARIGRFSEANSRGTPVTR